MEMGAGPMTTSGSDFFAPVGDKKSKKAQLGLSKALSIWGKVKA